jgi:hypothetical protein
MNRYEKNAFTTKTDKETIDEYNIVKFEEWQRQEKDNNRKTSLRCHWILGNIKSGIKMPHKERLQDKNS